MYSEMQLLIPSAGLGTRLFPVTWGIPKELFPLGNKPAIHYILEEAVMANLKNIICITSPRKESLITYLSYKEKKNNIYLTDVEKSKLIELDKLNNLLNYNFIVQKVSNGVANAMLCAYENLINCDLKNDFFCMAYPDDIIIDLKFGILNLLKLHEEFNCTVIAVEKVARDKISSYGIISYNKTIRNGVFIVDKIVEKPDLKVAPSEYGIVGRYILNKKILLNMQENKNNPCFIASLNNSINNNELIIAVLIESQRFDIGTVDGWINAINKLNKINILEEENYIKNINLNNLKDINI